MRGTGGPDCRIKAGKIGHRRMKFPAKLADIGHAQRADRNARQRDLLRREPTECAVGHICVRQSGEDLTRLRTRNDQHAKAVRDVGDRYVRTRRQGQIVPRLFFGPSASQQIEAIRPQAGDGPFAKDTAIVRQHLR